MFDRNTPTVTAFSRRFPRARVQLDNLDVIDVYVPASYATAKPTVSIGPIVTGPTDPYQGNYDNIRVSTF